MLVENSCLDISVFGLGKVGLTLAACLGAAGHRVIGTDINKQIISDINAQTITSEERGVIDRISLANQRFSATVDPAVAVAESNLTFIIVPTPSNSFGGFSLRYVIDAIRSIGLAIRNKKDWHVVAVVSTVFPESSRKIIIPILEQVSGRTLGQGLGYCYNPSFIALGDIVQGMERPDYLLIGESDKQSGDIVLAAHRAMIKNDARIVRMSPVEAEITKLASNTYETMRVSFVNMLLEICTETEDANVDNITNAVFLRANKRNFRGGTPYGGPCWPRDNHALGAFLQIKNLSNELPLTVDAFNAEHGQYIFKKILFHSSPEKKIGVIGLSYKPNTSCIEQSFGVTLIRALLREGRQVIAWDPLALPAIKKIFDNAVDYVGIENSDVIVILNPLKELSNFTWKQNQLIIDCWRCVSDSKDTSLISLGSLCSQEHANNDIFQMLIN